MSRTPILLSSFSVIHFSHQLEISLTEVIDSQVHLEAVCSLHVRTHHHSGVVNQDVQVTHLYVKRESEERFEGSFSICTRGSLIWKLYWT